MRRLPWFVVLTLAILVGGCGRLFADRTPPAMSRSDIKRVTFEVVARNNQCEPSVLGVDRAGRAIEIVFQVTSVGKEHHFLIPDLGVRRSVRSDSTQEISLVAERSGIYEYACASNRWIGPLTSTGKLAIK